MSIFDTWSFSTRILKKRSAELITLDASVQKVATSGAGAKDVNILKAFNDCEAWKTAQAGELSTISTFAADLDTAISDMYFKGKSQLSNAMSTSVAPLGWKYVAFDPLVQTFTTALPTAACVNATFTNAETMRMNEAMRRVKLAINLARDSIIRVAGGGGSQKEKDAYTDFFGATDDTRAKRIVNNLKVLAIAFDTGPDIIDLRNTVYGAQIYAACFRANLAVSTKGVLSLTGSVNMFLGRAFFARGNYEKTTDDTIGTLVHEFAHGAINAVDVPPVDASGAWTHGRVSDDPTSDDFGSSTDNMIQASTEALGKLLAQFQPDYSVVNADAYGQYARRILTLNKG